MNAYDEIKTIVGTAGWSDDADTLQPLLHDWRGAVSGRTPLAVFPK